MYSVNEVPLHNDAFGWQILRGGTQAIAGITRLRTEVAVPGYDGYFMAPSAREAKLIIFRMKSPLAYLEDLMALVDTQNGLLSLTDDPSRVAPFELVSALPSGEFPSDEFVYLTITLSVPGAAWRDADADVIGPITIANSTQTIDILSGISAPVRDMDFFLRGDFKEFQLVDSHGSWVRTTSEWDGSSTTGLLYIGATGQAFLANNASPWVPITDRSNQIDVSGGGGFKITPFYLDPPADPTNRRGRMSLTTLEQTDTELTIRVKNAYAIQ